MKKKLDPDDYDLKVSKKISGDGATVVSMFIKDFKKKIENKQAEVVNSEEFTIRTADQHGSPQLHVKIYPFVRTDNTKKVPSTSATDCDYVSFYLANASKENLDIQYDVTLKGCGQGSNLNQSFSTNSTIKQGTSYGWPRLLECSKIDCDDIEITCKFNKVDYPETRKKEIDRANAKKLAKNVEKTLEILDEFDPPAMQAKMEFIKEEIEEDGLKLNDILREVKDSRKARKHSESKILEQIKEVSDVKFNMMYCTLTQIEDNQKESGIERKELSDQFTSSVKESNIEVIEKLNTIKAIIEKADHRQTSKGEYVEDDNPCTCCQIKFPTCSACYNTLKTANKIFQCKDGHFMCEHCSDIKKLHCPSCGLMVDGRAFGMEQFLRNISAHHQAA